MLLFGAYFHGIIHFFHSKVHNWSIIKKSMTYSAISSLNDNCQKGKITYDDIHLNSKNCGVEHHKKTYLGDWVTRGHKK